MRCLLKRVLLVCWLQSDATNTSGLQLWSKPQPGGAAAVLVLSIGSTWGNHPQDVPSVTVNLAKIAGLANPAGKFKVRDIWNHADLPAASGGELITGPIKGGDIAFFLITPA